MSTKHAPRESKHLRVARLAYRLAQASLPAYSHKKSPHRYTQPQLATCVLLAFYFRQTYRDLVETLRMSRELQAVLALPAVPHYSTLCRMYHRLRAADWDRLNQQLLAELQPTEDLISVDGTGFSPTNASAYFQTRRGQPHRYWCKGVYAVGAASQLILAIRQGRGPSPDSPHLRHLKRVAGRYGRRTATGQPTWLLLGDVGFDGRAVGPRDLIPPLRRRGQWVAPERKARADLVHQARLDGAYGQRWKAETVNSVIKRKFGAQTRSRTVRAQAREPRLLGVLYNIYR